MDSLMTLISTTADCQVLPVPLVYPIPGEMDRQQTAGVGRQITQFTPGVVASSVYPRLSHPEGLIFVQNLALAFQEYWQIELPEPRLIGEIIATIPAQDGRILFR